MEGNIALFIKGSIQVGIVSVWAFRLYKNKKRDKLLERFHEVYENDDLTGACGISTNIFRTNQKIVLLIATRDLYSRIWEIFSRPKRLLKKPQR